jgi:hypothetical protein
MSFGGNCPECGDNQYNQNYFQRKLKCATCARRFPFCKACFTPTAGWSCIDGNWTPAAGWSCIDCLNREHRRKLIADLVANGYVVAARLLPLDLASGQQEAEREQQETCESPSE